MILVPLLNPKFATTLAARSCELRVRGTSHVQLARDAARRGNERADFLRVLLAGTALDAGGDIEAGCCRDPQRLRNVLDIEAAGEHEGNARIEVFEQPPVEALAEAARTSRLARCARVEDQAIRDCL